MKIIGLFIVVVLFLFTSCLGEKQADEKSQVKVQNVDVSGITYAFIDTDTLFDKYLKIQEVKELLEKTEKKLTADYERQVTSFKNEYENYLKVGATMTLSEQKKKEEYLNQRNQNIQQLEKTYAEQLMVLRAQKNQEVQDEVFSFIERYNKENGNFTMILSKARTSGVLVSDPSMDITKEVLEAINQEYLKKNKTK